MPSCVNEGQITLKRKEKERGREGKKERRDGVRGRKNKTPTTGSNFRLETETRLVLT